MIGLALGAKDLAVKRAKEALGLTVWYSEEEDKNWCLQSRSHARVYHTSPSAYYYRIIDNITAGRKP